LPCGISQRYVEKFADEEYFKNVSRVTKGRIDSTNFMTEKILVTIPNDDDKPNKALFKPIRYATFNTSVGYNGPSWIASFYDSMVAAIYQKTGVDFKRSLIEARKDPIKVRELSVIVDETFGAGTYGKLRKADYGKSYSQNDLLNLLK